MQQRIAPRHPAETTVGHARLSQPAEKARQFHGQASFHRAAKENGYGETF
jgi:hypothetical protein